MVRTGSVITGFIVIIGAGVLSNTALQPGSGSDLGWIAFGLLFVGVILVVGPFVVHPRSRLRWK